MSRQQPFSLPTPSFAWFDGLIAGLRPPAWLQHELENRLVLLLNHVLQQEPEAMARLQRQRGKPLRVEWNAFSLTLQATPAGLLERVDGAAPADLTVTVRGSAVELGRQWMAGERPPVEIQGDVQFAAEVAWLADNVRWDIEEDLSRVVGDAPAHLIANMARRVSGVLKQWIGRAGGMDAASTGGDVRPAHPSRAPEPGAPS
jgi:ubiquinone biosynthesis protein UbiJ